MYVCQARSFICSSVSICVIYSSVSFCLHVSLYAFYAYVREARGLIDSSVTVFYLIVVSRFVCMHVRRGIKRVASFLGWVSFASSVVVYCLVRMHVCMSNAFLV